MEYKMTVVGDDGVKRSFIYDTYHKRITFYHGLAKDFCQPVIFEIVPQSDHMQNSSAFLSRENIQDISPFDMKPCNSVRLVSRTLFNQPCPETDYLDLTSKNYIWEYLGLEEVE